MDHEANGLNIYTTIEDAKNEIWKRWNDKNLRKEVENYVKDIPNFMKREPLAMLQRHIASPNMDFLQFLRLSEQVQLTPFIFEYLQDSFVIRNRDKIRLAKMTFHHGKKESGEAVVSYKNVIPLNKSDGKIIADIRTLWGSSFVDFHHKLLNTYSPKQVGFFDMSEWLKEHGDRAIGYYKYEMALFICNGILFEDFLTDEKEIQFTQEIVFPAIEVVRSIFGLKPLILPIFDDPADIYCWCYPAHLEDEIKEYLSEKQTEGIPLNECGHEKIEIRTVPVMD